MAKKIIAERAADAILQKQMEVKVGDKAYTVAPPTGATLMLVSALIPRMPKMDITGNKLYETLAFARECDVMYEIVATLIIGAKAIRKESLSRPRHRLFGKSEPTMVERLADRLKYECTNGEVYDIASRILSEQMGVNDFFALSASLREISLMQEIRGAEETTALGQ